MAKEVEAQENASANAAKLKALQATIDKIEKDYDGSHRSGSMMAP